MLFTIKFLCWQDTVAFNWHGLHSLWSVRGSFSDHGLVGQSSLIAFVDKDGINAVILCDMGT